MSLRRAAIVLMVAAIAGVVAWLVVANRRAVEQAELLDVRAHLQTAAAGPPETSVPEGEKILGVARSYAKKRYPELWRRADSLKEYVDGPTAPGRPYECSFDGIKRGFTGYGGAEVEIATSNHRVLSSRFDEPQLEPPSDIRISQEQAVLRVLRYLRRKDGTVGDYQILYIYRWLGTDLTGPKPRPLWFMSLNATISGAPWHYVAFVDVQNGKISREGQPLSVPGQRSP